jgi:V-type H+-transporting ATPase subunit F
MAKKSDKTMLVGMIGDEDTVTGMLLTGIGERNTKGETNFYIIDASYILIIRIIAKRHRRCF